MSSGVDQNDIYWFSSFEEKLGCKQTCKVDKKYHKLDQMDWGCMQSHISDSKSVKKIPDYTLKRF